MSLIRARAADTLAEFLHEKLGSAVNNINATQADPEAKACYPYISVIPRLFNFEAIQEDEVNEPALDSLLSEVGSFEGVMELRVGSTSQAQRNQLADRIINQFLSSPGRPGVLVVPIQNVEVAGLKTRYDAIATFRLDSDNWNEEFAFDKKRFSFIDLNVSIPALVLRTETYNLNTLQTVFTEDLASPMPTDLETLTIEED